MENKYAAIEHTYLLDNNTTYTVFHPAIKFNENKGFCFFPDEGTESGLLEYTNEDDALSNAEQLYKHYVLDKSQ